MAKVTLNPLAKNISGKLSGREGTIMRQKKYRASNGAVLNTAAQEAYAVLNPRDYKKKPPKGAELRNINAFAEASRLTTLLIRSGKYTQTELDAMPANQRVYQLELREQLAAFEERFIAQRTTPDPQAPLLPQTDPQYNHHSAKEQRRQYLTLNTFIRAMILQSLKS